MRTPVLAFLPLSPSTAAASSLLCCTTVLPMVMLHHIFTLFICHSLSHHAAINPKPQPLARLAAIKALSLPLPLSAPQPFVKTKPLCIHHICHICCGCCHCLFGCGVACQCSRCHFHGCHWLILLFHFPLSYAMVIVFAPSVC